MPNDYFQFKKFKIKQDRCAMKVTTDGCLFGSWVAEKIWSSEISAPASPMKRILDIGAGTALLTLMIAQKADASIDAIEIDSDAFKQATENVTASPWNDRIQVYHGNATEFKFPSVYDCIVSNPPFYENELKSGNARKNLAHHGGMTIVDLLRVIKANLSVDGDFFLLLPYKRHGEIEELIRSNELSIIQKLLVRQSINHDYFRLMIQGSHENHQQQPTIEEISIWNSEQQYTDEFTELLKDYYLQL